MAKKIDLQPIEKEHIRTLISFLDMMGVNLKIDPDEDYVQEDLRQPFFGGVQGINMRQRYIKLEGMNINELRYTIIQRMDWSGGPSGGENITDKWTATYEYWVQCYIGKEKENLKNLKATIEEKKKGLFRREIVDFLWYGGQIADVLNQDTSLKEPLLAHLISAKTTGNDTEIRIEPENPPSYKEVKKWMEARKKKGDDIDLSENAIKNVIESMMQKEQGVWIIGCRTNGHKKKTTPLLLPSNDALKAYDRIGKHIREYAATIQ